MSFWGRILHDRLKNGKNKECFSYNSYSVLKIDTVRFQTSIEKENLLCYDKDRPKRKEIEGK